MSLLGMMYYCRAWIPDYVEISQPLSDLAHLRPMEINEHVQWNAEADTAFERLKVAVLSSPCLGTSDYSKPF